MLIKKINFRERIRRYLFYLMILVFVLPLAILADAKSAAASEGTKEVSPPKEKIAFLQVQGLPEDRTYHPGQSINWQINLKGDNLTVWAEMDGLDPNLPSKINLDPLGNGAWQLLAPPFSADLIYGGHLVAIFAQDSYGNLVTKQIKIILKKFPQIEILGFKFVNQETISIRWQGVVEAESYLVEWRSGEEYSQAMTAGKLSSFEIGELEPGMLYTVEVFPLIAGERGASNAPLQIQTPGAPKAMAAEITAAPRTIEPAIGEGVTTSRPVVQAPTPEILSQEKKEEEVAQPTPTPSTSPTQETDRGWNKLLVALSILIIAAAAAIGGYYAYGWLMLRSKDQESGEDEKSDKSSRW